MKQRNQLAAQKLQQDALSCHSSSSISGSKQAAARQVAAELIRRGDLSLSAPFHSVSGIQDNLLSSQVDNDSAGKGQYLPAFTEEQRSRLQRSRAERDERIALSKAKGCSASVEHASAGEHALWNAQRLKELQQTQEDKDVERITREANLRREQKSMEKCVIQEENSKALQKVPNARGSRSTKVESLSDLPPSFTAAKSVTDMHYCVTQLSELRTLAGETTSENSVIFGIRTTSTPCP